MIAQILVVETLIGGLLSKPPIRQNKFLAKISGHMVTGLTVSRCEVLTATFLIWSPAKPSQHFTHGLEGLCLVTCPETTMGERGEGLLGAKFYAV